MATYEITTPDGTFEVTAPDNMPLADVMARLDSQSGDEGEGSSTLGRWAGLAGRALAQGVVGGALGLPALAADAGANTSRAIGRNVFGHSTKPYGMENTQAVGEMADSVADFVGAPEPETARERIATDVGAGAASLLGTGLVGGAAKGVGALVGGGAKEVADNVASSLVSHPAAQVVGGAAGGGAASVASEAGAGPLVSTGVGVLTGGAAAVPASAGRLGNRAVVRPMMRGGQEQIVGEELYRQASDPEKVVRELQGGVEEFVPGSKPTLAQASGDPGLLRLERAVRTSDPFTKAMADSVEARNRQLDAVTPTRAQHAQMRQDRTEFNNRKRDEILPDSMVQADPTLALTEIDRIKGTAVSHSAPVNQQLAYARTQIESITDPKTGIADARTLYEIRQNISNRFNSRDFVGEHGKEAVSLAYSQVKPVIDALDDVLENAAPGYKEWRAEGVNRARRIDESRTMRDVRRKVTSNSTPLASNQEQGVIASRLRKMLRDTVDGDDFDRLSSAQQRTISSIVADLDRATAAEAPDIRAAGSNTTQDMAKSMSVAQVLARAMGPGAAQSSLGHRLLFPVKWWTKYSEDQLAELLAEAAADPKLGLKLMSRQNPRLLRSAAGELETLAASMFGGAQGANAAGATSDDEELR